ncbi:HD domain-containing phosphohydrolase [Deinococcus sp. QL22]|uniref:HD domain-containing phosphohydrolase n=1 Tax=Deinococcus sp. QL22 TaxID=2939437 RepID=UPI0020173A0C|nr:HD domain-containing phosphohydrolase [Deinococcus sp. QL22]UQN08982.1 diguanylate cyclase [Deinococcus sp. QL22]
MPGSAPSIPQQVLEDFSEAIYGLNRQLQVTFANAAALRFLRREARDVLGMSLFDLLSAPQLDEFLPPLRLAMATTAPTELEASAHQNKLWIRLCFYPHPEGVLIRVQQHDRLLPSRANQQDALTGALLRSPFLEALAHLSRPAAVAVVDLNHLKAINELHGHVGGDRHLRAFVQALRAHLPPGSLLCRWGGDEFVLVTPGETTDPLALGLAQLKQDLQPVMLQMLNNSEMAAFEFGLARLETRQTPFEQAFAVADEQLHTAKHRQRNPRQDAQVALEIGEFSRYLETLGPPTDVLEGSLHRLMNLLDFDLASYIPLHDGEVVGLTVMSKPGMDLSSLRSVAPVTGTLPQGGLSDAIAQQRQTVFATDYPTTVNPIPELVQAGIKSVVLTPVWHQGQMVGILNLVTLHRWRAITPQVQQLLELAALRLGHALELQRVVTQLRATLEAGMLALGTALEARDLETHGHTQRVATWATRLGQATGLSEEDLHHLRQGSYLHDLGKLMIPDAILLKPGHLTPKERQVMETHVVKGTELAARLPGLPLAVLELIASHHERWDGTGYPTGLVGEQIPLLGRLFAVCDVFDALVSERPYKAAWSREAALAEIEAQRGRQFCPETVDTFLALMR